jgi:tetratricopeptide (TPR) repeat protein
MDKFVKAEKHKTGCFGGLFVDYDKVYDNYIAAANTFKLEKNWQMCGEAYMYAGDISIKLKNHFYAIDAYSESAYAYIKLNNFTVAKSLFDTIIKLSIENNRLDYLGNSIKKFADILYDNKMFDDSLLYYEEAIKYLEIEDKKHQIMDCLQKEISIYENKKDYQKIIKILDKIIAEYNDNAYKIKMIEFYCKSIIYRISLITHDQKIEKCQECDDYLEKYSDQSNLFLGSKEYNICNKLLEAIEDDNVELMDIIIPNIKSSKYMSNISDEVLLQIRGNMEDVR